MTDLRKAAEMALEALEWNYGTDLENIENCMAWLEKMNATIPALRQALAQPVDAVNMSQERVDETAKREHEPVAWHEPGAYGNVTTHKDWALANGWEPLYKERT